MKKLFALLLTLSVLASLVACGGASQSASMGLGAAPAAEAPAMEAVAYDSAPAEEYSNALTTQADTGSAAIPAERKWIITMDISAETEDMDSLLTELDGHIEALGGYVEGQSIHNGSTYAQRRYRNANLTVRIPAQRVEEFATQVAGISNVVSSNKNLEDITLTYVSTESRMKALQTEEARLLELMEQAETMSDLLEIEGRLTDVRYELENVTTRLRTYDNRVGYATVYLYISEVQEYTPAAERTVWQRITQDFRSNLGALGEDLVDLFVWVVASSPYLVIYAVLGTGLFFLVKKLRRRKAAKAPEPKPEEE